MSQEYNPMKVSEVLNSMKDKLMVVRGNCDAEVDEMVLEFPLYPTIMFNVGVAKLELVHGHNLEEPLKINQDCLICLLNGGKENG